MQEVILDMVTKLSIRPAERELCDESADGFWQKNTWVDTSCMWKLVNKCVAHKLDKDGPNIWVLDLCDNLGAHLVPEVKHMQSFCVYFLQT